jgi:hypothetical protein
MFENSRLFFVVLLAGIAGVAYAAFYFSSVDAANASLQEARSKLASLHEIAVQRQRSVAELQHSVSQNREQQEKYTVLVKAKEVLDARVRKIEGEFKNMTSTIKVAVERARNDAPGKEIGDLTLANGKTLHAVKIRKLDSSSMSLTHADGIGSIPLDQLPTSMLEKYDFGQAPLLTALIDAEQAFADSGKPETAGNKKKVVQSTAAVTPTAVALQSTPKVDDAKVKDLKLKIAALESNITTTESTVAAFQQQANDQYVNGDIAKSRGTPATRYWTAAQQAAQQAQAYKARIDSLKAEKRKLEIELEYANKPK